MYLNWHNIFVGTTTIYTIIWSRKRLFSALCTPIVPLGKSGNADCVVWRTAVQGLTCENSKSSDDSLEKLAQRRVQVFCTVAYTGRVAARSNCRNSRNVNYELLSETNDSGIDRDAAEINWGLEITSGLSDVYGFKFIGIEEEGYFCETRLIQYAYDGSFEVLHVMTASEPPVALSNARYYGSESRSHCLPLLYYQQSLICTRKLYGCLEK